MNDISIIMPTFNRASVLEVVLPTYLCQDNVLELIIIDDGSTDETGETAARWHAKDPRVQYLKHAKNRGLPATRNTGIAAAKGRYIFNGEDDVVLNDDTFSIIRQCMAQQGADIVGCRTMYMYQGETQQDTLQRHDQLADTFFDMPSFTFNFGRPYPGPVRLPFFQTPSLIKKQVFDRVMFDERYWGSSFREETDFFIRCAKAGYALIFCPDAPVFNLPRKHVNPGGEHDMSPWKYELSAIINNWRFMNAHYDYLRDAWGLAVPRRTLQLRFTAERLQLLYRKVMAW